MTKREDVTEQGFCKILGENSVFGDYLLALIQVQREGGGVRVRAYSSLNGSGRE